MQADIWFGRSGMGWYMDLPHAGLHFEANRLRWQSGELKGELAVTGMIPGTTRAEDGRIHRASFNFSATRSRKELADLIAKRTMDLNDVDLFQTVERFCVYVMEQERKGGEVVKMHQVEPGRQGQHYLVEGVLPLSQTTIFFGDGGTGKSYLAAGIALSISSGYEVVPGMRPLTRGPVLYLDWETDAIEIRTRLEQMRLGLGLDAIPETFDYMAMAGTLYSQVDGIVRHTQENKTQLIVVDSVGMATGVGHEMGDANETTIRLFMALRSLGTTVLALDHVSKAGAAEDRGAFKPYGSAYKVNLARSVFEMRRGEDNIVGIFHRKANNSALREPVGLAYVHGALPDGREAMRFESAALVDPKLASALPVRDRVWRALQAGPMTIPELAEELDKDQHNIRKVVSRLAERGYVLKVGDRWAIAERRQDDSQPGG